MLPFTEANFVTEHRKILFRGKLSKKYTRHEVIHQGHTHSQYETVDLVLMSDCLIVCKAKQDSNANVTSSNPMSYSL